MTHEEDDSVVQCVIETVAKRVPVIVGAGSNNTNTMLKKSIDYEKMGADQLLLISPYYNKTNEEGMIQHFKTVADAVHIPIILYNIPGRPAARFPNTPWRCSASTPTSKASRKRAETCPTR